MSQYAMTQKHWRQMMMFSLLSVFVLFLAPLVSVGGEKYVKTDLCEIDLKECGLGTVIPYLFDVDEKDRVYYFEKNNQELFVFNKECGVEKRMAINNKIKKKDETRRRLQVRNGNMALYPLWDGNVILFKNLESGAEESIEKYVYTQYLLTYFDGKLLNFETSQEIASNPFDKPQGRKLGDCEYEWVRESRVKGINAAIHTLQKKGGDKKTKPVYKKDYFLFCVEAIDKNKNVYATYKRIAKVVEIEPIAGERSSWPYVVYEYMLIKFDKDLNELCSWGGDYFYVNEDTMNVYVLKNMKTMPKFEKWVFDD